MKALKIIIVGMGVVAAACVFPSCAKTNLERIAASDDDLNNKTLVQVFNATVNSARTYVYVDGVPVTGAALTYGNVFPSTAFAFSVNPGLRSFLIRDTLITTTQAPIAFAENMDVKANYTIFMYDTTTAAKQITIKNNVVIPSDTTARLKFANFIHNSFAVPAVDVFSVKRNANIFTNVDKTQATDYIPYASASNDTFLVRETGTTNLLIALNGFNPTQKRSYTLIYRGSYRGTKAISVFPNN